MIEYLYIELVALGVGLRLVEAMLLTTEIWLAFGYRKLQAIQGSITIDL